MSLHDDGVDAMHNQRIEALNHLHPPTYGEMVAAYLSVWPEAWWCEEHADSACKDATSAVPHCSRHHRLSSSGTCRMVKARIVMTP